MRLQIFTYLLTFGCSMALAQNPQIVDLPFHPIPGVEWVGDTEMDNTKPENPKIKNVSKPSIEIFRPEKPNGAAVIIAPGGGLRVLSIESEGRMVARWLASKGITSIVLKYRTIPTVKNKEQVKDGITFSEDVNRILPYSIRDALNAIDYIRINAENLQIDQRKIGFMGFSAGGAVAMGVAYFYEENTRPDFIVPIYAWTKMMPVHQPKQDSPPMLVICAADDPLGIAPGSVNLYNSWVSNGLNAGLFMYSKGGHGFGMLPGNLSTDRWIERFYEWAMDEGFVE